jgi:26S proteasome regulatory subunit N11
MESHFPFDVYISNTALEKAERIMEDAAKQGKEALGLLVGEACRWKGAEYVIVDHFITASNNSTAVSVKFNKLAFSELSKAFASHFKEKKLIVGWIHSHPSYGCWLSATDMSTQHKFFAEPFNIAMVVDPLKKEGKRMQERVFRVDGNAYYEVSFAVIDAKK